MNVSDEILDVASKAFAQRYYGGQTPPRRELDVRDALRDAIKAILPLLLKAAAPQTDEERLRAAWTLCVQSRHNELPYEQEYNDRLAIAEKGIGNALSRVQFAQARETPKMMHLIHVGTYDDGTCDGRGCDGELLAWYECPDGKYKLRRFGRGEAVPKEIEMPT